MSVGQTVAYLTSHNKNVFIIVQKLVQTFATRLKPAAQSTTWKVKQFAIQWNTCC